MNLFKTAKIALLTGFAAAALMTQPILAHAEEIVTDRGDGAAAINHGVTVLAWARVDGSTSSTVGDDVIVDGIIITAENYDAANSNAANDSEWKYVNVRRTVNTNTADTPKDAFFVRNDATTVAQ